MNCGDHSVREWYLTWWKRICSVVGLCPREFESHRRRQYGDRTVLESTKVPDEVVALTCCRGLQFSFLYLGQGESCPRGSVEMRESTSEPARVSSSLQYRVIRPKPAVRR